MAILWLLVFEVAGMLLPQFKIDFEVSLVGGGAFGCSFFWVEVGKFDLIDGFEEILPCCFWFLFYGGGGLAEEILPRVLSSGGSFRGGLEDGGTIWFGWQWFSIHIYMFYLGFKNHELRSSMIQSAIIYFPALSNTISSSAEALRKKNKNTDNIFNSSNKGVHLQEITKTRVAQCPTVHNYISPHILIIVY